jgi:2-hydroxymuconate-semialdehyde hydrolase
MTSELVHFENGLAGVQAGVRGLPVILLHPIGLASSTWRTVQPVLAEQGRTLALDLLGFGASRKPVRGDYSLQAQASRVLEAADELGWDRFALVGNSLGGGVSLATAVVAPERVVSLTLMGSVAYPGGLPPLKLLAGITALEFSTRLASRVAGPWVMRYCFANRQRLDRKAVGSYADVLATREGVRAFRLTARALYGPSLATLAHHYRDVRCPALILHGDRDPIIPRWVPRRLREELAKPELRWLTSVGHFPQEEAPEQLLYHLVPFLYHRDLAVA